MSPALRDTFALPEHYRNRQSQLPPLTPFDPLWAFWNDLWETENEVFAHSWGHLPERWQDFYRDLYQRHKEGLAPKLTERFAQQLAECLLENWDLFGPVVETILKKTKQARKEAT